MVKRETPRSGAPPSTSERDRLAKPQPPAAIPPRAPSGVVRPPDGRLAYTLLGAQVIK
jgi:hypothetical protein